MIHKIKNKVILYLLTALMIVSVVTPAYATSDTVSNAFNSNTQQAYDGFADAYGWEIKENRPKSASEKSGLDQEAYLKDIIAASSQLLGIEIHEGGGGYGGSIVEVARQEVGTVGNSKYSTWYNHTIANVTNIGTDWCAMFVSWCAGQCGFIEDGTIAPGLGVSDIRNPLHDRYSEYRTSSCTPFGGSEYTPVPGDIAVCFNGIPCHIGIVSDVSENTITFISGNSGSQSALTSMVTEKVYDRYAYPELYNGWIIHVEYPDTDKAIYNYLRHRLNLNKAAACGVLANLYAESGCLPTNLENQYEGTLGYNDASYTEAVDNNTYHNFMSDHAGYGLVQWTDPSRKTGLYKFAKQQNVSIGNMQMQLDYLAKELEGYSSTVLGPLRNVPDTIDGAKSAAEIWCRVFERPANVDSAVANRQATIATFWNKYQN